MDKGIKYISIVGVERCGKGTQIEMLKHFYGEGESKGVDFAREPGTTALGEILRAGMKPTDPDSLLYLSESSLGLLSYSMKNLSPEEYFLMMMLQRHTLMRDIMSGRSGDRLISDRGHMCTFAYQLTAQKLAMVPGYTDIWTSSYGKLFSDIDDLHILLDITPKESINRKAGRKSSDPFDDKAIDFIGNVEAGYKISGNIINKNKPGKARFVTIDGMRSKEDVFEDLKNVIQKHFED